MPINYNNTDDWIEAGRENPEATYSFADVCTLIHMAKNEISRMYVHESVLDERILIGYSNYSFLNDDEVRLLMKSIKHIEEQKYEDKLSAMRTEMNLQQRASLLKLQNEVANSAFNDHLETIKKLQFAKVGGEITDGTSKQEDMVL